MGASARRPSALMASRNARSAPGSDSAGEMTRERIESWLAKGRFAVVLWEDHSDALAQLAAQLVLTNGSLEGFLCSPHDLGARPGYFLLVARAN